MPRHKKKSRYDYEQSSRTNDNQPSEDSTEQNNDASTARNREPTPSSSGALDIPSLVFCLCITGISQIVGQKLMFYWYNFCCIVIILTEIA